MKIAIKTFGCKANFVDTDGLHGEIQRLGMTIANERETADAYLINSCTVTRDADRDARLQAIRYKRENPNAIVGVIGCYAQVAKEELLQVPEVDFVLGTAEKLRAIELIDQVLQGRTIQRDQVKEASGFLSKDFRGSQRSRPSLKIQDGCNFSCTFCIIPKARGRSRSLEDKNVLELLDQAQAQGFEEVTLTGIHLAHFGWDRGSDLMTLIKEIVKRNSGPRVRLSTLDPFEIPDELISIVANSPVFCPHYHIALQSGSDSVLKRMRRIYKAIEFVQVTNKIGRANPNTFIGVDVIVGFPGETDEEFQQTIECLENSYWTKLHVFPYSVREGTPAEEMPHKVDPTVIARRSQILREMSDLRNETFMKNQVGREVDVVIEKLSPKHLGYWKGHTENYLSTYSLAPLRGSKQRVTSKVIDFREGRLWTEPLSNIKKPENSYSSPRANL